MHSLTLEKGGQRYVLFGLGKSVWCLQSAKDNWPIINKDSQELTRYYYVSTFSCRNKTIIWKERSNHILNYHFTSSDTHMWTKFAFTAHDRFFVYVQQSLSRYSKNFLLTESVTILIWRKRRICLNLLTLPHTCIAACLSAIYFLTNQKTDKSGANMVNNHNL